jgi:hypothetical protein
MTHLQESRSKPRSSRIVLDDDPCISTRAAADYTGYTPQYFRAAIKANDLRAEYVVSPGKKRGMHLIRFTDFVAFLKAIGFKRIPGRPL